ncbi:MAG TPA: FHA domain-containing protein [Kineosporiaceae bacterium]|nr:FHA domain-containing protein [Kineosporiaceae bacterium]
MSVTPPGAGQQPERDAAPGSPREPAAAPDTTVTLGALGSTEEVSDPGLTAAEQAAIEALPAGSALLVVRRGPNAGARFLLDGPRTTAGRRPDSDIFLDDVTVSRKHAEFLRKEGRFVVRDVGSLNGTYVQRDRIEEVVLRAGDEVQIGKYRMIFHPSPRDTGAGAGW